MIFDDPAKLLTSYEDNRPRTTKINHPSQMTTEDKIDLYRNIKFNPLCGRLGMDALITDRASHDTVTGGIHKLFVPFGRRVNLADANPILMLLPNEYGRGHDSSANGMYLTKPVVSEAYLHIPSLDQITDTEFSLRVS